MVEARKQPQQSQEAASAWAAYLVKQSNVLIDTYSQVLTHAWQYPNVRGEDVRGEPGGLAEFVRGHKPHRTTADFAAKGRCECGETVGPERRRLSSLPASEERQVNVTAQRRFRRMCRRARLK